MDDFYRIKRLPSYVLATVTDLKAKARARGEDIIDLGMGNPDRPTPRHIVDKLVEAAKNPRNHRYSASRGIRRLRPRGRAEPPGAPGAERREAVEGDRHQHPVLRGDPERADRRLERRHLERPHRASSDQSQRVA